MKKTALLFCCSITALSMCQGETNGIAEVLKKTAADNATDTAIHHFANRLNKMLFFSFTYGLPKKSLKCTLFSRSKTSNNQSSDERRDKTSSLQTISEAQKAYQAKRIFLLRTNKIIAHNNQTIKKAIESHHKLNIK